MPPLDTIRIRPITEAAFDSIIEAAGGIRAHPDHDRRQARGADYVLGAAVLELKILEDEGLAKQDRQHKLATLFCGLDPKRPVHVLDRGRLDEAGKRTYDRAMEGPIKKAVKSAKGQLVQSRKEYPDTTLSILILVNNGNTALNHADIVTLVERRARNDTDDIDGVVVAGAYLHGDGFEAVAFWPIDYIPIRLNSVFPSYDRLRDAFHGYAEEIMTAAMLDGPTAENSKGPVLDTGFDLNGIHFVKPAPAMGKPSDFYVRGRPRVNSTGLEVSPKVGIIFPELSRSEWNKVQRFLGSHPHLGQTYEDWLRERENAAAKGELLKPMIPIDVSLDEWLATIGGIIPDQPFASLATLANRKFQKQIRKVVLSARDAATATILPRRFVLACTEVIGQDMANDVSSIFLIEQRPDGDAWSKTLVGNARIFHEHACTLGGAYAVKHSVSSLLWQKDLSYAWI